jgi:hypothetical protein
MSRVRRIGFCPPRRNRAISRPDVGAKLIGGRCRFGKVVSLPGSVPSPFVAIDEDDTLRMPRIRPLTLIHPYFLPPEARHCLSRVCGPHRARSPYPLLQAPEATGRFHEPALLGVVYETSVHEYARARIEIADRFRLDSVQPHCDCDCFVLPNLSGTSRVKGAILISRVRIVIESLPPDRRPVAAAHAAYVRQSGSLGRAVAAEFEVDSDSDSDGGSACRFTLHFNPRWSALQRLPRSSP